MIAKLENNILQIIADNIQESKLLDEWKAYNTRQYRHNDNSGYVAGFDIGSIKIIELAKPAYRVYRLSKYCTGVVDRFSDGTYSPNYAEDLNWMGDWTEYDQIPKKWPTPLVDRIAAIDLEAAQWITDNWDDLRDGKYTIDNCRATNDLLLQMFNWGMTPQGHYYWHKISRQLGE